MNIIINKNIIISMKAQILKINLYKIRIKKIEIKMPHNQNKHNQINIWPYKAKQVKIIKRRAISKIKNRFQLDRGIIKLF